MALRAALGPDHDGRQCQCVARRARTCAMHGGRAQRPRSISFDCSAPCTYTTVARVRLTDCFRLRNARRRLHPCSAGRPRWSRRKRCWASRTISGAISLSHYAILVAVRDAQLGASAVTNFYGFHRDAEVMIARTQWLHGFPDQAALTAANANRSTNAGIRSRLAWVSCGVSASAISEAIGRLRMNTSSAC